MAARAIALEEQDSILTQVTTPPSGDDESDNEVAMSQQVWQDDDDPEIRSVEYPTY